MHKKSFRRSFCCTDLISHPGWLISQPISASSYWPSTQPQFEHHSSWHTWTNPWHSPTRRTSFRPWSLRFGRSGRMPRIC